MHTIISSALVAIAGISCSAGPAAPGPTIATESVCDVPAALAAVRAHFEAIDRGDAVAAERGVAEEPQFEWYAVYPNLWSAEVDTSDRSALAARLQELADSDWTLTDLNLSGVVDDERQLVHFSVDASVTEFGRMGGKGAVTCGNNAIIVIVVNLADQAASRSE